MQAMFLSNKKFKAKKQHMVYAICINNKDKIKNLYMFSIFNKGNFSLTDLRVNFLG